MILLGNVPVFNTWWINSLAAVLQFVFCFEPNRYRMSMLDNPCPFFQFVGQTGFNSICLSASVETDILHTLLVLNRCLTEKVFIILSLCVSGYVCVCSRTCLCVWKGVLILHWSFLFHWFKCASFTWRIRAILICMILMKFS